MRLTGELAIFAGVVLIIASAFGIIFSERIPQDIDNVEQIFCRSNCQQTNFCIAEKNRSNPSQIINQSCRINITAQYNSCLSECAKPV